LLFARSADGAVWLAQRPPKGVRASLFTFPIFDSEEALMASLPEPLQPKLQLAPAFVHVLTHKDLHLHVAHLALSRSPTLGWGRAVVGCERLAKIGAASASQAIVDGLKRVKFSVTLEADPIGRKALV
jgi:A/G-specific adenine glycosylase